MQIKIANRHGRIRLPKAALTRLIKKICSRLDIGGGMLSFVFTSDLEIRSLNKKFFAKDQATDVIAFDLFDQGDPSGLLGEIIISLDQAIESASRFSGEREEELSLYIIHGLLHLKGFKDKTQPEKMRMRKKEKEIIFYLLKKENRLLRSIAF
jgi:probable rRNA maturation factor